MARTARIAGGRTICYIRNTLVAEMRLSMDRRKELIERAIAGGELIVLAGTAGALAVTNNPGKALRFFVLGTLVNLGLGLIAWATAPAASRP